MDNKVAWSILQRLRYISISYACLKSIGIAQPLWKSFLSLLVIVPTLTLAAPSSDSKIEWSMPDRLLENTDYPGYDPASPVPKYDPTVQMLPADGWLVHFDVCSDEIPAIVGVDWFVDGVLVANQNGCLFDYKFPDEAVYEITAKLTDEFDNIETISQEITVQDWLIIALGDSYGSGEGNPIQPVSSKALEDYSQLISLVSDTKNTIQITEDKLPELEEEQQSSQQRLDESLEARDDAENEHIALQNQLQAILDTIDNVENDPSVLTAEKDISTAESLVGGWLDQVDESQKNYNKCTNFINCAILLSTLNYAKRELQAAEAGLETAKTKLAGVKDDAADKYSSDASIKDFDDLTSQRDAKNTEVQSAKNTLDKAKGTYQNAVNSLQQAIDAVIDSNSKLVELKKSAEDATLSAQAIFIDNLPVWTNTAPSWGTPEPDYSDIILNGATPGEALRCHRSMNSGQARAALELEQADPHTSVTFLHLSCSGASINNLTGTYKGQDIESVLTPLLDDTLTFDFSGIPEQDPIQAQIAAASLKITGREPDAIIISIGANDTKFSNIINECILGQPCHEDIALLPIEDFNNAVMTSVVENCRPTDLLNKLTGQSLETASFPFTENCISQYNAVDTNIAAGEALRTFNENTYGTTDELGNVIKISLTEKFQKIQNDENINNATLDKHFPTLDSKRVYLTQYLNPTADDQGNYCGWSEEDPVGNENLKNIPGVTASENTWTDLTVAASLNEEIQNMVDLHQWTYVTKTGVIDETIASTSKQHGYCADNNWVIRLPESLLTQQDNLGILHPNRKGHELYQQAIVTHLMQDFYPDGLNMPPRAPDKKQSKFPTDDTVDVSVASESSDLGSLAPAYMLFMFFVCLNGRVFLWRSGPHKS